jgi:prepilin-type N-terminal cleavage/methylation domain-containing protein
MKGGDRPLGYTIIEVMIVLAVSGVMFMIAATFISGKEASTAFTEGSNEFATQLQTVVEQVVDGQYSDISFNCAIGGDGLPDITLPTAAQEGEDLQGTNSPCIFLGKFIHFDEQGNLTKFEVFSLASSRLAATIATAPIQPIAPAASPIDLTDQEVVPQSLQVKYVLVNGEAAPDVYGIGFVQSLGTQEEPGLYTSGAQSVSMVYSTAISNDMDEQDAATQITGIGVLRTATSAVICLTDGSRYAELDLGNDDATGSELSVNLEVVRTC